MPKIEQRDIRFKAVGGAQLADNLDLSTKSLTLPATITANVTGNVTGNVTFPDSTVQNTAPSGFGFKNRLINGNFAVAQRATSGTSGASVPTTSPVYPCVDRWYVYATGATVTASRGGSTGANTLSVAGAESVTGVGIGQRIEAQNCADLAGGNATLSLNISNSTLTTVTWVASYAAVFDTWSSKTQIATGTFTVNSTSTAYSTTFAIPAAATTGIEILFTVGAQTSGTFAISNVQFEKGSSATAFDYRPYGTELQHCLRYFQNASLSQSWTIATQANIVVYVYTHPVPMRATPTVSGTQATPINAYATSVWATQTTAGTINALSSEL